MSSSYNCGDIEINKVLEQDHKEKVAELLDINCDTGYNHVGDDYITLGEWYGSDLEDVLWQIINYLEPFGYVLNGSVSFFGDYGDGRTEVADNKVTYEDASEFWRKDASDEELIEVLENRGYVVTKKGDET